MQVMVIGGGIGGLCLAHGLKKAGVSVAVFERESATRHDHEGYSIQINSDGNTALHECLPDDLWQVYLATTGRPVAGIRFMTQRMRRLLSVDWPPPSDPAHADWRVSRPKLKQVLLAGLDNEVQFGKKFVRYERTGDSPRSAALRGAGHIEAFFEDGSSAVGDVLVGADGVTSNVRKQFLPQARVRDLHISAIGAKYLLTEQSAARLPGLLTDRMTIVLPPRACGMFITKFVLQSRQETPDMEDHLFWAVIAHPETFGATRALEQLSLAELQDVALRIVHDWDPALRQLVTESDPHTFTTIALHSADVVPEWATTNVTLLGDAIHTMTPLQGLGGNTALRDARLLCQSLVQVERGHTDLLDGLGKYEVAMRAYGSEAVRASLQYTEMLVSSKRLMRATFEGVLRVADRVPALKDRMFPAA